MFIYPLPQHSSPQDNFTLTPGGPHIHTSTPFRVLKGATTVPHPLLSVAGRCEARRFLAEVAELLSRCIPARLRLRSFSLSFLLVAGGHAGELGDCDFHTGRNDMWAEGRAHTQPCIRTEYVRACKHLRTSTCAPTLTPICTLAQARADTRIRPDTYSHTHLLNTHTVEALENDATRISGSSQTPSCGVSHAM